MVWKGVRISLLCDQQPPKTAARGAANLTAPLAWDCATPGTAAEVGRRIDPEHFGISLAYTRTAISAEQAARIAKRRPGLDPAALVPVGMSGLREMLERYIDVGFSKFVLRPGDPLDSWPRELDELATGVLALQT